MTTPSADTAATRRPEHPARPAVLGRTAALAGVAVAAALAAWAVGSRGTLADRLLDPGFLVTWGLPAAQGLRNLAATLAIGCLGLVALCLPGASRARTRDLDGARAVLTRAGALALAALVVLDVAVLLLTWGDVLGVPIGGDGFWARFPEFVIEYELGSSLLWTTALAALALPAAASARRLGTATAALALTVGSLLMLALAGHAGSSYDHANAVNLLAVHLVGVTAWAGGLAALVLLRRAVPERDLAPTVRRYSQVALACYVLVALSGIGSAAIRLTGFGDLVTTAYGQLLLVKIVVLVALGIAGAMQRSRLLPRLDAGEPRAFARIAALEAGLLVALLGLSAALARTATPQPQDAVWGAHPRAESLIGYPVPPHPFQISQLFTVWEIDWAWAGAALALAGLYLAGVRRLARRGDRWPVRRTVWFLLGCVALFWVTSGGAAAYGRVRFDVHMVQHMSLMIVVPPLLVLGGAVTLLTRAVAPRTDGSRGVREWVLVLLHSRFSQLLSTPVVAGLLFSGSLYAFYFSPLFGAAMESHAGHVVMTVHFLLSGYLFAWVMIGVDPGPNKLPHAMRLLVLLATLAFHAFFGIAVMSATGIIGGDWFRALDLWTPEQLAQFQTYGGNIAWGVSEVPTLVLTIGVMVDWSRSEERRAKQLDRRADRDHDADLTAYNAWLGQQGERDRDSAD